jgi:magnesium chelatase family protein
MRHLARVYSAELEGISARLIEVEVDINVGLHSFNIVGLADKATSEAKERVNSALKNSGIKPPNRENRKIIVNLAPADVKKTGSQYDLAIAIGYLLASGQIKNFDASSKIFAGELSLEGKLRPIRGALSIARLAKKMGFKDLFLPPENCLEAALVENLNIFPVNNLEELINHLEESKLLSAQPATILQSNLKDYPVRFSEIKGQKNAKRALQIAAAGGHHVLMAGPPGAGKTMMAQALVSILPPLSLEESIEITQIWSAAGFLRENSILNIRPFRAPHHTASPIAIIGGGVNPRPGEISLAHLGVLFLDEMPEFRRDLLEALRQPLESGMVHVARAKNVIMFPSRFTLVAAMNPCPCGYFGDLEKECRCTANEVFRYQKKVSGPLLDRIDIQINVPRVSLEDLLTKKSDMQLDEKIEQSVVRAREIQSERFSNTKPKIRMNVEMSARQVEECLNLDFQAQSFLKNILEKSSLSARGYYRILKISRTIADLAESEKVLTEHLAEAFQYRLR